MLDNSSILKNLISRCLSLVVSTIVVFLIGRIVVEEIGSDAYGFFLLSNDFVGYATIISLAISSMANRYIAISFHRNSDKELNIYFNSLFFSNVILSIILIIPVFFLTFNLEKIINIPDFLISDVKWLFLLVFVSFLLQIIFSIFSVATFAKNRVDLDSFRNTESNIIKFIFIILVYKFLELKVWHLAIASLIANIYMYISYIYYTRKFLPQVKIKMEFFDFRYIKDVLSVGIWNSFTKLTSTLLTGLDLIIANIAIDSTAMGQISIAKTIPKLFFTAVNSVASVFTPSITEQYAKENVDNIVLYLKKGIRVNSFISVNVLTILFVLGQRIFVLWVPSQDAQLLQNISIMAMFSYAVVSPVEVLWSVFTVTNKVKISSLYLFVQSILSIGTVFLLLQFLENTIARMMIIVGISGIYEIVCGMIFLPIASASCLKVKKTTFYPALLTSIFSLIVSVCIASFITAWIPMTGWIGLFLLCVLVCCIASIVYFIIVLNKEERRVLKYIILKIKQN